MNWREKTAIRAGGLAAAFALAAVSVAPAQSYINEIFFNPGGDGQDGRDEYIELRGTANASLDNHFLVIVEAENSGQTGEIENIFDLNGQQFGSNGFLVLRQRFSLYNVNPAATDLVNNGPFLPGPAFPGFGSGENSTIGASDLPSTGSGSGEGQLEGSGFTAFLIRNDSGDDPVLGQDLDEGDDGLDVPTGAAGWTILDSIGFITELDELEGKLYAQTNFIRADAFVSQAQIDAIVEPGSQVEIIDYELEYLARWGNSTGSSPDDWHATNLTDNAGSGSLGVADRAGTEDDVIDWRQSLIGNHPADDGDITTPAPPQANVESNQGVPYGTQLTNTIGGPNLILGDFGRDGFVNAADYVLYRDSVGLTGITEESNSPIDASHDFEIDGDDLAFWFANFGGPDGGPAAATIASRAVPEPLTAGLLTTGLAACGFGMRRRSPSRR